MRISRKKICCILLAAAAAAFAAYKIFGGVSDEAKIINTVSDMVSLASKPEAASPAELALKLRILQRVFADKVTIDFGARRMSDVYTPRSLEPMLANFRKSFVSTTASMSDEELRIDKVRADIVFACRFRGKPKSGIYVDEVRDVTCSLQKTDGVWKIDKVVINDILER